MRAAAPLLAAKLLPPHPDPHHLLRPRLVERLAAGLDGTATVVTAGPGYGKTALVSHFIRQAQDDAVWYRLDSSDRDPWVFFSYLIEGIREHVPDFGERSAGLWEEFRSGAAEVERLADIFIRDAEESLGGRLMVVMDQVEHLEEGGLCARGLRRLLDYMPGALHLVLVGRSLPDLGIRSPRADGPVNVLAGDDLLLTRDETASLLQDTFGLSLDEKGVEQIHRRTRGWVTALQLMRRTAGLERGPSAPPEALFNRTEGEIFEYFSAQVLDTLPADVRRFLLAASIPAVIDPDLCAEALPDLSVRPLLQEVLRHNLFLSPLESRGEYYTFDPLFRDSLRRRLRGDLDDAHRRRLEAAFGTAFARRGEFSQALAHWRASEDVDAMLDLLGRQGRALLAAGLLETVREAAGFVAGKGRRPAAVEDLLGEACRLAGDPTAAVGHFQRALQTGDPGSPEIAGQARAAALQGLAHSLLKIGRVEEADATARQALAASQGSDPALEARIGNTLSVIRYRENALDAAVSGWQEALARARQAGDEHLIRMIAHNLGLPHAVMGDFRRASECFGILTGPDKSRVGPEEGAAYLNLGRIEILRGNYARAASLLGDAREIANRWKLQGLLADVLEAEGNLLRDSGDLAGAAEQYRRARSLLTELGQLDLLEGLAEEEAVLAVLAGDAARAEQIATEGVERRREGEDREALASALLALGEVRCRAGRGGEAEAPLSEAAGLFAGLQRRYQEFLARLWLGLAHHRQGKEAEAKEASRAALDLAGRHGYEASASRIAGLDASFAAWLGSLPGAPAELAPAASRPAPTLAGVGPAGVDLSVRLLGPVEVCRDAGTPIPAAAWKVRRALQIFCYLAAARDHRATKDRIVDALWGEARPAVIEKNFHPTISFLRRALNHGHGVTKNFILFQQGAYRLNPDYRYHIDVEAFEAGIRDARRLQEEGEAAGALAAYEAALELYRGHFLEEEYDAWTEAPRAHFEGLRLQALEEASRLHLAQGNREQGVELLRRTVEAEPLNEEASARLMTELGAAGNRSGVEREFQRLTARLQADLEAEPLPETRAAYQAALGGGEGAGEVARRPPRARRRAGPGKSGQKGS